MVTLICDSGNKYLSKMFNDFWMRDQGYLQLPKRTICAILIMRRHQEGAVITVSPERFVAHGLSTHAHGRYFTGASDREWQAGRDVWMSRMCL